MKLTPERIEEINRMPVFMGVIYGNVTPEELEAWKKIPLSPERVAEVMRNLQKRRDDDATHP